jgi:hypothetical protein
MLYAPVFALSLAAVGCLWLLAPRWTSYAVLVVLGYELALGSSGVMTPGSAFPGRFELIWMPLLAVPLMVVLSRIPVAWLVFLPLLVVGLALTYQASERSGSALVNTGTVRLPLAARLQGAFPDIETPPVPHAFATTQPSQIRTAGHLVGTSAVATPSDGPGFLTAGPGSPLAAGTYKADFTVAQRGAHGDSPPFAQLQVWAAPGLTLAQRDLTASDVRPGRLRTISVSFATPGGLPIETRVWVYGSALVRLGPTEAEAVSLAVSPLLDAHPAVALMAFWCFIVLFLGALLVTLLRAQGAQVPLAVPRIAAA